MHITPRDDRAKEVEVKTTMRQSKMYRDFKKYVSKPRDYAKVTMSNYSMLLQLSSNFDYKNPQNNAENLEIYTIDSDYMIKIWDLSYSGKEELIDGNFSKSAGKCKESIILRQCEKYN